MNQTAASAIAHQIELAVAPVFLLAGIGALLNVMAQRLARIVERARILERVRRLGNHDKQRKIESLLIQSDQERL